MKTRTPIVSLLVLAGCIDFVGSEQAFCDNAAQEHRAAACADRLGPDPAGLLIEDLPASLAAGECSGTVKIRSVDGSDHKALVRTETDVILTATPSAGVSFYSDEACTTPTSTVSITAGGDSALFAFKSSTVGTLSVRVSVPGLANGAGEVQIARGNGNGIAFLSPAQSVVAGTCSAPITVQLQRGDGSPVQFSSDTYVGLASDASTGMTFFDNSGCSGSPITTLTIGAGQSNATFHFKMTAAGPVELTVSAAGLVSATQTETVSAGPPSRLAITTEAQSPVAGSCSGVVVVEGRDSYDNTVRVVADTALGLSALPSAGVTFYSDAACATGTTQAIIRAGTASASFYFKGTSAGAITVSVDAAGLTTAAQAEMIRNGPATRLSFGVSSITPTAGVCSMVTLRSKDAYDNVTSVTASVTVALAASSSRITLYATSDCSMVTTRTTIAAGQSLASFYVRGTVAGLVSVTASAPGFTPDYVDVTIQPASPSQIVFTSAPPTVTENVVSGPVRFAFRDVYGNDAPVSSTVVVWVEVDVNAGSGGDFCPSPSSCQTSLIGSVTISPGQSSGVFYVRLSTQYSQASFRMIIRTTLPGGPSVSATQSGTIIGSQ